MKTKFLQQGLGPPNFTEIINTDIHRNSHRVVAEREIHKNLQFDGRCVAYLVGYRLMYAVIGDEFRSIRKLGGARKIIGSAILEPGIYLKYFSPRVACVRGLNGRRWEDQYTN